MILAKPLTLSDITMIREFATSTRKQQAVVLPKDFMRSLGFEYADYEKGFELAFHFRIYGPASHAEIDKPGARISRQSNDWRVDQCIIRENEYSPGRFSSIEEGDIFLLNVDIEGGLAVAVYLGKTDQGDSEVIRALGSLVGIKSGFSSDQLLGALKNSTVSPDHVVWSIVEGESSDDLVLAGGLAAKGAGACSPDKLKERLEEAERIGFEGEKKFAGWLATKPVMCGKVVESFEWTSQENATSPYDFVARLTDGNDVYIEVKTTTQNFDRDFYISSGELAICGFSSSSAALNAGTTME